LGPNPYRRGRRGELVQEKRRVTTPQVERIFALLKGNARGGDRIVEALKEAGFTDPNKSLHNLHLLNNRGTIRDKLPQIIQFALDSANPDLALNQWERLVSALDELEDGSSILQGLMNEEFLRLLIITCGSSPALVNIMIRDPACLIEISKGAYLYRQKGEEQMIEELEQQLHRAPSPDYNRLCQVLRWYRNREILRIGMRDLGGLASLEDTMAGLTDLACACLEVAYRYIWALLVDQYGVPKYVDQEGKEEVAQFVIIGLGKLGACELNFSSDIDLMYLYSADKGETTGTGRAEGRPGQRLPLPQFFTRMAELITRAINEPREEGRVFRVDLRLRPEGTKGNLAYSLRSAEIYYESWGQPWERIVLLKARPVAGDKALGERFLKMIEPFVYRKYLDYTVVEEIREMKEEIDRRVSREEQKGRNIKLGAGGIREIEFFIQVLQIINGGKDPSIRETATLKALPKLRDRNYISAATCHALEQAYRFLRQVEHKIQIVHTRQSHLLPRNPYELSQLARRMGYRDTEEFLTELDGHTSRVKEIYGQLFYTPGRQLERPYPPDLLDLLREDITQEELLTRLEAYGFREPAEAQGRLRLLKDGPPFVYFPAKAHRLLRKISPILMQELIKTPDPDAALAHLERFLSSIGARTTFLSLLAENPSVIQLLMHLFGGSDYLARLFINHPELLDSLVRADSATVKKNRLALERELGEMIALVDDYEDRLDQLRLFKHAEILRIGMASLAGKLDLREETQQLTMLAEVCLQKAYEISLQEMRQRYGLPHYCLPNGRQGVARFSIIALGRLGGREMSYNSDLDIIFIYSHEGETGSGRENRSISNHEYFVKLAQKIITTLSCLTREGYVYKVDTRLRPSGNAGPLVSSWEAFQQYQGRNIQAWERQVLTKGRWVAGDRRLGALVVKAIRKSAYSRPLSPADIEEIRRLRTRMENELARETSQRFHLKLGKGSLLDVQFIVQYLQLRYGGQFRGIREVNTARGLRKLYRAGLLPEADYAILMEAWKFFLEIENRLRIARDRSLDTLIDDPVELDALARRLSYGHPGTHLTGEELLNKYKYFTQEVRKLYLRYLSAG